MRVVRQIGEHRLGPGERALGVDVPAAFLERRQIGGERLRVGGGIVFRFRRDLVTSPRREPMMGLLPASVTVAKMSRGVLGLPLNERGFPTYMSDAHHAFQS